jgi:hypothetical protein
MGNKVSASTGGNRRDVTMNIKDAKEQIKNAIVAYFTKDESGDYIVPIEKQRPVFLMGPPGIGKTAIMEQIASEMGVGLLSYSMAHHTRQSALGLPFIEHKNYRGLECDISEYTMSEIIAAVYEMMEETGVEEGILFLDEINCVSETLAPVMLQFLQYKVFGKHRVPDGWIVVTAGNPPEYNNSVLEFDIVTWDRLKRVDVDPDFGVWKEYAYQRRVHPSIMTYLEIRKADFYTIESTVYGKSFVTARGWDDLSQMIQLYEMNDIKVDQKLIEQYIQNPRIAKDFAIYYDLYQKYKSDYQVDSILSGKVRKDIKKRAENAKFDERLSLIGMLLDAVGEELKESVESGQIIKDLTTILVEYKSLINKTDKMPSDHMSDLIGRKRDILEAGKRSGSLSRDAQYRLKKEIKILEKEQELLFSVNNGTEAFSIIKKDFDEQVKNLKKAANEAGKKLSNMFKFLEEVFTRGQEILIVVTELTLNPYSSTYISRYGCEEYFKHNKDLLLYDRQKEIEVELANLKID